MFDILWLRAKSKTDKKKTNGGRKIEIILFNSNYKNLITQKSIYMYICYIYIYIKYLIHDSIKY